MNNNGTTLPAVAAAAPAKLIDYAISLKEQREVADVMIRSGLLPKHYNKPETVMVAMWAGQELGFSALTSLRVISVIEGTPSINAAGMKAKMIQHGGEIHTVKWTDRECTLEASRAGWKKPESAAYTWDDAIKQGLAGKQNWQKMPKAMLYARCISILARNVWADVLAGVYCTEELMDAHGRDFSYDDDGNVIDITPVKVTDVKPEPKPAQAPRTMPPNEHYEPDLSPQNYALQAPASQFKGERLIDIYRTDPKWIPAVLASKKRQAACTARDLVNLNAFWVVMSKTETPGNNGAPDAAMSAELDDMDQAGMFDIGGEQ